MVFNKISEVVDFDMELIEENDKLIKKNTEKVTIKKTKTLKHSFNIFNCVNTSTVVLL